MGSGAQSKELSLELKKASPEQLTGFANQLSPEIRKKILDAISTIPVPVSTSTTDGAANSSGELIINAGKHSATLVLLHGWMQHIDCHKLLAEKIAYEVPHLKVIVPQSPKREVTKLFGPETQVPCWCQKNTDGFDWDGLKDSVEFVRKIIEDEVKAGVPRSRIVLGGFSQGATVAAWTSLHQTEPVAGILLMSGGMYNLREKFDPIPASLTKTSILVIQGEVDKMYKPELQYNMVELFKERGYTDVELKKIPDMDHSHFGGYEWTLKVMPKYADEKFKIGVDEAVMGACSWLLRVLPGLA